MSDSEFMIRSYQGGDREEVISLWRIAFAGDPPRNEPTIVIERKQLEKDGLFFVGILGEQVVGTVLAGFDGVRGWVYHLAVAPELKTGELSLALMTEIATNWSVLLVPSLAMTTTS